MSRAAVAGLCGRSEEWLRQIERGRRGTGLKMVARLAEVLKVKDLTDLLGDGAPTAIYARPEHAALGKVRQALTSYAVAGDNPPDVDALDHRVRQAWRQRSMSNRDRTDLAAVLPDLIVDAQRTARASATPSRRRDAYRLMAEAYHLGQLYLCYQNAPELLWVIVDRGMNAAVESEDPATLARATWFSAYLFRDFGLVDHAHQVVEDALRQLDAERDPSPTLLRQRAVVHLASAWNHARDGRPAQAWRAWDAAVAAEREGPAPSPHALFGATASDVALTLDVELGKSASALRRAEATDVGSVTSVPRRARLMIEAARGHMLKREYVGTVHLLRRAHETSPEATLFSMYARGMVVDLLDHAGPMLQAEVADLADRLGVAA